MTQLLQARSHEPPIEYEVVHHLPGRVRVRLARSDAGRGAALAEALSCHPAVRAVRWAAPARSLTVTFDPGRGSCDLSRMASETNGKGRHGAPEETERPLWKRFLLPAISLVAGLSGMGWLASAVIAVCAAPVVRRAVQSVRARRLTIDVLDTIAVGLLLAMGDTLAGGVSVALIEGGERLRMQAAGRARHVLRGWLGVSPRGVRVQQNGSEPRVPVEAISPGDRVVIYPGEAVPIDGVVVSGSGSLDTQSWSGEVLPSHTASGSAVLAGCALVDGRIVVEVTATGDETRAGRLAVALEEALAANTQVSDLARSLADRFVLPVLVASGSVLAVTRQLPRAVSMLIFDYGTGVRIAIPTTILATMIAGARQGTLFKSGRAIEDLARVDTVIFDKTGTLTSGAPTVVDVTAGSNDGSLEALRLAAAAEGHLPHPIARAIRKAARRHRLTLTDPEWVRYHVGGGVEAQVDGCRVLVGDRRLLEDRGIRPPRNGPDSLCVHVACDGHHTARIRLKDRVRDTAAGAVTQLRKAGVRRVLLASGDRRAAAGAVARRLGLDGWSAELMPEDKVDMVERLRAEGATVAVVGDGLNDAPAMVAADVSVAVPRGADLARNTADIVLMTEDLHGLVTAIELSRKAMVLVRQNIGVVAVPNSLGMVLATLGGLGPLHAAILNNGSTLVAAMNGLRPLARPPVQAHHPKGNQRIPTP